MPIGHGNSFLVVEKSWKSHGKSLLKKNGHPGLGVRKGSRSGCRGLKVKVMGQANVVGLTLIEGRAPSEAAQPRQSVSST